VDFQDKPSRNPNNYNILKGGQVDPGSKLYQRSVAGRQKLEDYVKDLWDQGKDEKDVFMAAVESLMNRGHGYVGAYLDSKNPGRRYTEPQAMKIADEVMSKAGIGSHPGARLTPAKDDEEREARKGDRAQRREARKAGPAPAPAAKAKPVGQQRKEGQRTGTAPVAEDDTRRAGIGAPETGPVSDWQKTLEDRMKGEATTSDVLAAFQKQYQSRIKGGAAKPAEDGAKAPAPTEATKPTPPAEESKAPAPAEESSAPEPTAPAPAEEPGSPEETDRVAAPTDMVANTFRKKFNDAKKQLLQQEVALARKERRVANPKVAVPSQDDIDYMVEETVDDLADRFDIDYDTASDIISKQFRIEVSRKGGDNKDEAPATTDQTLPEPDPWEGEPEKRIDVASKTPSEAPAVQRLLPAAKETVRNAATEPLPDFRNAVMRQLKLPLGSRDAKTRIAEGAAGRREQKLEGQRTRTEQEMAKAARARQRTAPKTTQPELFTPTGKPKQFKTEPASNPIANAVADVGKILRSPDVKKATLDSFARMVLNGIERHKKATGGKGFG
jgi:hypothetical protein